MTSSLRRVLSIVALLALAASSGLHVVALQATAWVRMYQAYSLVMPKSEALSITLSGDAPCGLCLTVDRIQAASESSLKQFHQVESRLLLLPLAETQTPFDTPAPRHSARLRLDAKPPPGLALPVATPPPKRVDA